METQAAPQALPEPLRSVLERAGLRLERTGRRADVVLARPERRNAQSPNLWAGLAAAGLWLSGRADVVVLRAEGPAFSAGLDRRAFTVEGIPGELSLLDLAAMDDESLDAAIAGYQEGFAVWSSAPFISIAAVHGHAVGAGFQLALATDLRVVAADVQFAMRETQLGLVPDLTGTYPLVSMVGYSQALEICATGRWIGAEEAERLGLAQRVASADQLVEVTDQLVAELLAAPAFALRAIKPLLAQAPERTADEQRAAERAAQAIQLKTMAAALR